MVTPSPVRSRLVLYLDPGRPLPPSSDTKLLFSMTVSPQNHICLFPLSVSVPTPFLSVLHLTFFLSSSPKCSSHSLSVLYLRRVLPIFIKGDRRLRTGESSFCPWETGLQNYKTKKRTCIHERSF